MLIDSIEPVPISTTPLELNSQKFWPPNTELSKEAWTESTFLDNDSSAVDLISDSCTINPLKVLSDVWNS